ncbi:hypothetical protein BVRB_028660 [Beta vulgaris subsp. vulgaris]|uniref:Uncharacterized protein n=1 Tax=Beta vulgaris subsp. vulgaris TaxID=3555 RepID=A0A0J8B1D8_BETVV|nr:hypothetical protein BVRB_028660 [Beta vulgaris subsp. vulgaris]
MKFQLPIAWRNIVPRWPISTGCLSGRFQVRARMAPSSTIIPSEAMRGYVLQVSRSKSQLSVFLIETGRG